MTHLRAYLVAGGLLAAGRGRIRCAFLEGGERAVQGNAGEGAAERGRGGGVVLEGLERLGRLDANPAQPADQAAGPAPQLWIPPGNDGGCTGAAGGRGGKKWRRCAVERLSYRLLKALQ